MGFWETTANVQSIYQRQKVILQGIDLYQAGSQAG